MKNLAIIMVFFAGAQFFFGVMAGICAGTAWDKRNMRGKEMCDWAHERPHSYFAYGFYPMKYGQRVGCFLIEPKFNLSETKE